MPTRRSRPAPTAAILFLLLAAPAAAADPLDGYRDPDQLLAEARRFAAATTVCAVEPIGSSAAGRDLVALVLSGDPATAGDRPAVLIVAGLDARHAVGPETALRVAQTLASDHEEALDEVTVYVVPLVNADGAGAQRSAARIDRAGNLRGVDEDRDGRTDEDGPIDLDGDGFITTMRRAEPPLGDTATHLADPAAPRLLRTPDAAKGERAVYAVYAEGLDADGDGGVAEDGPGSVDLDRNFMHEWPEYELDSGAYQLSEPGSSALASFVLAHRNIVACVTYGRHDNLINVPDGKGKDVSGRGPKVLHEDDVPIYKEIGRVFREITGQERAPKRDVDGSFHAWLYAQRGVPSFATVVWGRPDASEEVDEEDGEAGDVDASDGVDFDGGEGKGGASGGGEGEGEGAGAKKKKEAARGEPGDKESAAWLAYSDRDRDGAGFVPWAPFDHPTLGAVEIGGFVPGFRMNPPGDELEELAGTQAAFIVDLIGRRPRLALVAPTVRRLAGSLYEVRFGIVNEGYLPSATRMARTARSVKPTVVRLEVPVENVLAGDRVARVWGIDGSGGRSEHRWIVRADDGAPLEIRASNPQLGEQTIRFTAEETR